MLWQTTSWDYDAGGQVIHQHDPRGSSYDLSYTYDGVNRRTVTSATNLSIQQGYDALGQRTSLQDSTGTTTFNYDPIGRIFKVTPPSTTPIQYSYNARGDRTQLTYPNGTLLSYGYDPNRNLTVVTNTTTLASYSYDTVGRVHQTTRANGATSIYTYDSADRLQDASTNVGSTLRSRFQYGMDRLGDRMSATETLGTQVRSVQYGYDGLQRLTSAAESPGTSYGYSYSKVGNRTKVTTNGSITELRAYNAADQVNSWQYDQAGNLLSDGTNTNTYDALNRLTSTVTGSTTTSSSYNGDGVLVSTMQAGTTTQYVQDLASSSSQILQSTTGTTNITYLYGRERLTAVQSGVKTWYGMDALGSVRQVLSNGGVPLKAINYDPWGQVEGTTQPGNFGFTGELQDATTGLVNLRARWYQPTSGKFVSRDPFSGDRARPVTLHSYQYGWNNPISNTDPSGKCTDARVPWIGEAGCSIEEGILNGNLDLEAGSSYAWDVFQGVGSPGAWIGDQFTGGNAWQCIWATPTPGKVVGGAFTSITLSGGAYKYIALPIAQRISTWLDRAADATTTVGPKAVAPIEKFSNFVFKAGATHGKDEVFRALGYDLEDSPMLKAIYEQQALSKFQQGQYTLGKLDQWGQRIDIEIVLQGIGNASDKVSYIRSGWMIHPDGLTLNTPMSGFTR